MVYNLQFDLDVKCEHEDSKNTYAKAHITYTRSIEMVVIVKKGTICGEKTSLLNDSR